MTLKKKLSEYSSELQGVVCRLSANKTEIRENVSHWVGRPYGYSYSKREGKNNLKFTLTTVISPL